MELLDRRADRERSMPTAEQAFTPEQIEAVQEVLETIDVARPVRSYIVDVVEASREDARVEIGVSPRGLQRLFEASRASAVIDGREFVTPTDVKSVAPACLTHRLVLTSEAAVRETAKGDVMRDVIQSVPVPT